VQFCELCTAGRITLTEANKMEQHIFVIGSNDANCRRIKETLRRRFKNAAVQVNGPQSALVKDRILVVADSQDREVDSSATHPRLEERIARAEFLFEATRRLSFSNSLPQMLNEAVTLSQDVLGDTAFVILMEGDQARLQCATSKNYGQLTQSLISIINSRPPELEILLQTLLAGGEALFIPDLETAELPHAIIALAKQLQFKSIIATPIKKDGRVFGVFISASSKPNHLTEAQAALSQEFSQAIAVAVEKNEMVTQLEQKANTDSLTGLYNTRFFTEVVAREVARAERHQTPLSLLLVDIDNFKRVNDVHGHIAGNEALNSLAQILQQAVRMTDLVFRCGGDEFGVVLEGTDLNGALRVGENIRGRVEAAEFLPGKMLKSELTVSIGASEYVAGLGAEMLLTRADQALYRAKELSKNNVQPYDAGSLRQTGS
jgi:diguanylate cyclase (GGDEF)-like protein